MNNDAPIVIVGTGLAGYSLAREIRKLDKDTPLMLITADDGHSYSKPMLSTGFTKQKTADDLSMADPAAMADQLNAIVRTYTTVTGIHPDKHELLLSGERQPYRQLILAWGADVIRPDLEGSGLAHVHSVNDLMDYRQVREALQGKKRVLIMGAGLIGCEFANDLLSGGYEIDVVAPSDRAFPNLLPKEAAEAVGDSLSAEGVRFHFGEAVTRVDEQNGGVVATLTSGATVEADLVISAIGLHPRTALAELAGLETGKGIIVDRQLQTSAPDIYALGDCAEVDGHVLLYVLPLMAAARALAKTLTGEATPVKYGAMPVVIKTPSCPVVVSPPPAHCGGTWEIEGSAPDIKAVYKSATGESLGFCLTGSRVAEKQLLTKEMPPVHPD